MDLRQLEHFLAAADEKNFTRAARRMNIVQSGLSASVRALEHELKAELFVRTTRRVELTSVGEVFYEKAQRIVAAAKDARAAVDAVRGVSRGRLSIGTVQSIGAFIDLPDLLDDFHARYPEIEIQLRQEGSTLLLDKIRDGDLDLAFVPLFEPPPDIATIMIACEDMVMVCRIGHPLADRKDLTLAALKDEAFIDFQSGWGTRLIVDDAFAEAGIDRRIAFEVADLGTKFDLVARGLGIALVPERLARARMAGKQALPIAAAEIVHPQMCWELVLAFAQRTGGAAHPSNPAARAFIDVLRKTRDLPEPES